MVLCANFLLSLVVTSIFNTINKIWDMVRNKFDRYQEYGLCVLFHLVFPLVPMFLELWISGSISSKSLLLSTAIYAIAIGNSSRFRIMLGLCIFIAFIFCVLFGVVAAGAVSPANGEISAKFTLIFLFLSTLAEKHGVHVSEGRFFWDHGKSKEE